jgi:hypothetical protein
MFINHWRMHRQHSVPTQEPLDLETNMRNTLRILELASTAS